MEKIKESYSEVIWKQFEKNHQLTKEQLKQFKDYYEILLAWNREINLTTITGLKAVVRNHFNDSLILNEFIDLKEINSICDIGTGAGFPAIPLKIIYPHLKIFLIEVNKKKQKYLNALIENLKLENIEIIDLDWRTFLRKTDFDIDLFVTRATLHELELIRMFKPACFYKHSKLIYWASINWEPYPKAAPFITDYKTYKIGNKERKLVFMQLKNK